MVCRTSIKHQVVTTSNFSEGKTILENTRVLSMYWETLRLWNQQSAHFPMKIMIIFAYNTKVKEVKGLSDNFPD